MNFKNYFSIFVLLCLLTVSVVAQSAGGIVPGVIRVKFKPQVITSGQGLTLNKSRGNIVTGINSVDKLNTVYAATSIKRVFPYSPKFEERHIKHGLHLWYEIEFSVTTKSAEVLSAYSKIAEIEK